MNIEAENDTKILDIGRLTQIEMLLARISMPFLAGGPLA